MIFIKQLNNKELEALAADIREFIIKNVAATGGHLASNLGVVEITIAMHYVFDSPNDMFLFDVGHQSYTHKILTGRAKDFKTLRKRKTCREEYDFLRSFEELFPSSWDNRERCHRYSFY